MQKSLSVLAVLILLSAAVPAAAQKFFTRDAKVQFYSDAKMEKIEAVNKSGTAVVDIGTGRMEWKVLIKNFLFEKALMQEHFNENYMESSKYPTATFKGQITNPGEVHFGVDGSYTAKVSGKLNIHNVERDVNIEGTITVSGGAFKIHTDFFVNCADYNIKIEAQKISNIAKDIKVTVDASLAPMK